MQELCCTYIQNLGNKQIFKAVKNSLKKINRLTFLIMYRKLP